MIYEQAYYTWSNSVRGLNIPSSTREDDIFKNKCEKLGAFFVPEHSDRTAQIVRYFEAFGCFVAVGISPAESGRDGRKNMLCHFFIPETPEQEMFPEDYYIPYPFRRTMEEKSSIQKIELAKVEYNKEEILKKYDFTKEKIARLLQVIYENIYKSNQKKICFLVDKNEYQIDEYATIAREIMWLISALMPREDWKKLTYGVYIKEKNNCNAVQFVFADCLLEDCSPFLLNQEDSEEEIPEVYHVLAEKFVESEDVLKEFWNELKNCAKSEKKVHGVDEIQQNYCRWKLNNNQFVSEEDVKNILNNISRSADLNNDSWCQKFVWDYLKQAKHVSGVLDYFYVIETAIKEYNQEESQEKKDFLYQIIEKLYKDYQKNNHDYYKKLFEVFNSYQHTEIPQKLYEQENSHIKEELQKVKTINDLKEYMDLYGNICIVPEEQERIWKEKSLEIYESAEKSERERITKVMFERNCGSWKEYIKERIASYSLSEYLIFLKEEKEKIESEFVAVYLQKLIELECEVSDEQQNEFIQYGDTLLSLGLKEKLDVEKTKLNEIKQRWEERKALQEMNKKKFVELLLPEYVKEIYSDNILKEWSKKILKFLDDSEQIDEEQLKNLLETLQMCKNRFEHVTEAFEECLNVTERKIINVRCENDKKIIYYFYILHLKTQSKPMELKIFSQQNYTNPFYFSEVKTAIKEYAQEKTPEKKDFIYQIVEKICKVYQRDYPEDYMRLFKVFDKEKEIPQRLYEQENSYIKEHLKKVETINDLKEYMILYGDICIAQKEQKRIWKEKSFEFYENAEKVEREKITNIMLEIDCELWNKHIKERISSYSLSEYLTFLKEERWKIESRFVDIYLQKLITLEGEVSDDQQSEFIQYGDALLMDAGEKLYKSEKSKWDEMKVRMWKRYLEKNLKNKIEEINRLIEIFLNVRDDLESVAAKEYLNMFEKTYTMFGKLGKKLDYTDICEIKKEKMDDIFEVVKKRFEG